MNIEELSKTIISFGKHAGKTFDDIDLSYLEWLQSQDWLRNPLKDKLTEYLEHPLIQKEMKD